MRYVRRQKSLVDALEAGESIVCPPALAPNGARVETAWGPQATLGPPRPKEEVLEALCRARDGDGWVVLADESGGGSTPWRLAMVVVPPGCVLPRQSLDFHARDDGEARARWVVDALLARPEVSIVEVVLDRIVPPTASQVSDPGARDPHLVLWHGLLLAMDHVASRRAADGRGPETLRVYVEQAGALAEGDVRMTLPFALHRQASERRPGFAGLRVDGPVVVAKQRHPWMAYPDAVALLLSRGTHRGLSARTVSIRADAERLLHTGGSPEVPVHPWG